MCYRCNKCKGAKGFTGATGATGATSAKGATGFTGAKGGRRFSHEGMLGSQRGRKTGQLCRALGPGGQEHTPH